jgi:hypothetical protein
MVIETSLEQIGWTLMGVDKVTFEMVGDEFRIYIFPASNVNE